MHICPIKYLVFKRLMAIIASLFLGISMVSQAQHDTLVMTPSTSDYPIFPYIEVVADDEKQLFPKDILKQKIDWKPAVEAGDSITNRSVHWLKFSIKNNEGSSFENYRISVAFTDKVSLYVFSPDHNYSTQHSGDLYQLDRRPVKNGQMVFMQLNIPYQSSRTCFLRLESTTDISQQFRKEALKSIHIYTEEGFEKRFESPRFYQAFFYGAIFIMMFYNFFIFISLKSLDYLYYVFYLLALALFFISNGGYLVEIVLPNYPRIDLYIRFISTCLVMMAYIRFSQGFLNTSTQTRLMHKVLWGILGIYGISLALMVVANQWKLGRTIAILLSIVTYLSILVVAIKEVRKGYTPARYFLAANFLLILGALVFAIPRITGAIQNPITQYGVQLGVILEVSLLSIGLADRINVAKREVEESRLIAERLERQQEKERQELIEAKNKELEEKVVIRTQEVVRQKDAIEKINKNLTDSINYAKRIQQAVLGDASEHESLFEDFFVLFKPKDIVSGDFFWVGQVGSKTIIIAADCTGHGVPGAFMTMMGHSLLNEIIHSDGIWLPDQILTLLDDKIRQNLHSESKNGEGRGTNDGMDMAIITIDHDSNKLWFAGAKNPLCYIRDGEIHRIKGGSSAIGGRILKGRDFPLHELTYKPGDSYYVFSDGFQDQFGGPQNRKFLSTKFRELLFDISHMPMAHQQETLWDAFEKWRDGGKQTDDVLVIGVKP